MLQHSFKTVFSIIQLFFAFSRSFTPFFYPALVAFLVQIPNLKSILTHQPQPNAPTPSPKKMLLPTLPLLLSTLTLTLTLTTAAVLPRQANAQSFTGALGGIAATPILDSGNADRPFAVKNDTFVNIGAALQRSCDQQFNACANAANGGDAAFSTQECQAQKGEFAFFVMAAGCLC